MFVLVENNKLIIPIHYRDGAEYKLMELEQGDWIDIPIQEDISVEYKTLKHEDGKDREHLFSSDTEPEVSKIGFVVSRLGFSMVLPKGYEAHILPRSSTFKRYGLLLGNEEGIVDNSYNGINDEWLAVTYATRPIFIPKGTRLFQFRIVKTMRDDYAFDTIDFVEDDELFKDNRDRGGFGSTGK